MMKAVVSTMLIFALLSVACSVEPENDEASSPDSPLPTETLPPSPVTLTPEPESAPATPTLNALSVAVTQQALTKEVATPIPTVTPGPTSCEEVEGVCLRLAFDGVNCTYEGPAEIESGQLKLIFINESGGMASAGLFRLIEGVTFQDVIDYTEEEPYTLNPPPFVFVVNSFFGMMKEGRSHIREGVLEPGIHTLVCVREDPPRLFYGGGFLVEE